MRCSYCKDTSAEFTYCMQHSLDYSECYNIICKKCFDYSKCSDCGSHYCKEHSLSNAHLLKQKLSEEIVKKINSNLNLRCYGCSCYDHITTSSS